ncbi:MAG TPA: GNAT family N-acetyltransferase [Candidatus Angelobacter sp.]|jgi:CelD/BcsL family acetyltransferase involved in cellulose biosynthesis
MQRHTEVLQAIKIKICRSAGEMLQLRSLWESIFAASNCIIFQSFELNLLAAGLFAGREEPYVVCAESSEGVAIVPAALRHSDGSIRLLGEELFDYRGFLHTGDPMVLRVALAALAELERPMEILALREPDRNRVSDELQLVPFAAAPGVSCAHISAKQFGAEHPRLARNLRRLEKLGFAMKSCDGANAQLLHSIYARKAAQITGSLFHDRARIEFLVRAAALMPDVFEIFTLENSVSVAAALVVLHDQDCRRFYTGWFAPEFEKHSPALSLIYEVTRQSLAAGLNCDYMTGEQPYKLRLATNSVPLYRLRATPEQLAGLGRPATKELVSAA